MAFDHLTRAAVISVAGHDICFVSTNREAHEYLASIDHLVGIRPYRYTPCEIERAVDLPTLEYSSGAVAVELKPSGSLRLAFPWHFAAPAIFDDGEPFHNMLLYILRMLLEGSRQARGEFTFHASAVEREGRAVVIMGAAEAGKTTTAMHLCRKHGFRLIANDQVVIGERRGKIRALLGQNEINLRRSSLGVYSRDLEQTFFQNEAKEGWNQKRLIRPSELGIVVGQVETPVSLIVKVRLDAGMEGVHSSALSNVPIGDTKPADQQAIFMCKAETYAEMTAMIRGSSFAPLDEKSLDFVDAFLPSLDRPEFLQARTAFLNLLFSGASSHLVSARGSLESVCSRVVDLLDSSKR